MMDSIFSTCEITEAEDDRHDLKSVRTFRGTHQKAVHGSSSRPPSLKLGSDKGLEDDINKLFEAIKLKSSSNSLYLPEQASPGPARKNSMKKPVGMGVPRSPGIGFSEPVSLKQALRGLCISQASEMATIKRLSMPTGSPRVSEASKIASLYRSVVVEAGESSGSLNGSDNGGLEICLVPEEGTSNSPAKLPHRLPEHKSKLSNLSAHSSPRFALTAKENVTNPSLIRNENIPVISDFHHQMSETESEEDTALASLSSHRSGDNKLQVKTKTMTEIARSPPLSVMEMTKQGTSFAETKNEEFPRPEVPCQSSELLQEEEHPGVSTPCHNYAGTTESTNIPVPVTNKLGNKVSGAKLRRKAKVQALPPSSSRGTSNKADKKAVTRKKPVVKKNLKQDSTSVGSNSNSVKETKNGMDSTGQLLCQRCRCTVTNAGNGTNENSPAFNGANTSAEVSSSNMDSVAIKPAFVPSTSDKTKAVVGKASKGTKTRYKEDFSQSSKSSIGDFSSSTSISDDSNGSGSTCGNRPHMSKDLRWDAIRHVRKLHGFLGLGHFNLLKKLGSGDIGTVYLAELIGTNCLFAIKVMDNEFLARRKKMPRAQTEREILRILDHPFLPTLYAQFTSDNLSCLVMEYCPGGDLHVLRQKQPGRYFPEQAARFYVAEVLLALEYLHMLGVIYRDLKPENIMVREDGHIMLTDFDLSLRCTVNPTLLKSSASVMEPPKVSGPCNGSSCIDPFCIEPSCQVACFSPRILPAAAAAAKERKRAALVAAHLRSLPLLVAEPTEARSNSFVGTHEYLAPEIIKGDGHGSAVDWWTLGIFLYELIYGKTPFKGAGNEETLGNVVLQSLRFPESPLVSFQARDLIRRLLVKEPENRLGYEKGAAEIKQHPFFEGLNWALIRCAIPPELPEFCDVRILSAPSEEDKEKKYLEYGDGGEHLEFELF